MSLPFLFVTVLFFLLLILFIILFLHQLFSPLPPWYFPLRSHLVFIFSFPSLFLPYSLISYSLFLSLLFFSLLSFTFLIFNLLFLNFLFSSFHFLQCFEVVFENTCMLALYSSFEGSSSLTSIAAKARLEMEIQESGFFSFHTVRICYAGIIWISGQYYDAGQPYRWRTFSLLFLQCPLLMILPKLNFIQILCKTQQIVVFWVIWIVLRSDTIYLPSCKIEAICFSEMLVPSLPDYTVL